MFDTTNETGACFGHPNPELWFPEDSRTNDGSAAKAICRGCPARERCLAGTLEFERNLGVTDLWGIYGGLDATERRQLLIGGAA